MQRHFSSALVSVLLSSLLLPPPPTLGSYGPALPLPLSLALSTISRLICLYGCHYLLPILHPHRLGVAPLAPSLCPCGEYCFFWPSMLLLSFCLRSASFTSFSTISGPTCGGRCDPPWSAVWLIFICPCGSSVSSSSTTSNLKSLWCLCGSCVSSPSTTSGFKSLCPFLCPLSPVSFKPCCHLRIDMSFFPLSQ